jgi:quercetin 2,3-dioxygenase
MLVHYPTSTLGKAEHTWLSAQYHFNFARYHADGKDGLGSLLVWNNDTIQAGQGFDPHPHQDMEIFTFVYDGILIHEDSLGNTGYLPKGHMQLMSAGTGIVHSERADIDGTVRLFQLWITPKEKGINPRWQQMHRPTAANTLPLLASGHPTDTAPFYIHQNAAIYGGLIHHTINHTPTPLSYMVVATGTVRANGIPLAAGDGLLVAGEHHLVLESTNAEVVLVDVGA